MAVSLPATYEPFLSGELEIPPGTMVSGVFSKERVGREPREEYEAKSTVRFVPGTLGLPAEEQIVAVEQQVGLNFVGIHRMAFVAVFYQHRTDLRLEEGHAIGFRLRASVYAGLGRVCLEPQLLIDADEGLFQNIRELTLHLCPVTPDFTATIAYGFKGEPKPRGVLVVQGGVVTKAGQYAYRDRRQRKRQFRTLWISRINAAARVYGMSYSRLINGLNKAEIEVDRKVLADIAVHDPEGFGAIAEAAKAGLEQQAAN